MIQGFGQEIVEIPAFGHDITEVRAMGELVWQKSTSLPDYLCFTALEAGQFTLTIPAALSTNAYSHLSYIEWSKDGRSWNRTENKNSTEITIPVDVVTGDKVYWRGSGTSMTSASVALTSDCRFTSTARFNASGHLLSLLKLDDYDATTGWSAATFANLFYQSATLIDASGITLPALAAGNAYTFYGTFYECTNLVAAPDFNTSYTGNFMCFQMYRGCTSLTTMPKLPTTLSTSIFSGMFRGCTSLAITQPLNYSTLAENCFANMFNGCSSLAYVKCLATDISATGCLTNWIYNVSSTGTFIQAAGVTWPRGASGIPTGWLAYDEGEDIPNDYTPCDYIYNSSTGGGGVDLGFKFRLLDYSVEAKFKQDEINNGMVCGTNANDSGAIWYYNYTGRGSFRVYACYSRTWQYDKEGFTPIDTDIHTIRYVGDADGCYQISDGTQSTSTNLSTWAADESTNNLFIFGRAVSSNTYKGRIYYLKVWNTATEDVICNLIPCSRNSDGAAGFWDTAQERFFTSTYWTAHNDNE